jgi:hypothetical protein
MATYHGINQLDSVVLGRIVAGRDHDAYGRIALLGTDRSNEPDSVDDVVQPSIAATISSSAIDSYSHRRRDGGHHLARGRMRTYAFMRNYRNTKVSQMARRRMKTETRKQKTYSCSAIFILLPLRNGIRLGAFGYGFEQIPRQMDHRLRLVEDGFSRIEGRHDDGEAHRCAHALA